MTGTRVARWLADHNPLLLFLSAFFVIGGGYLVAAGMGSTFQLIGLFVFIQLYELALLGGASFLQRYVARRDPMAWRDVAALLSLEILFLGDLSFTNSVFPGTGTTGVELGIDREDLVAPVLAAAIAILLGPLKLALAGRAGKIEWPRALYGYLLLALTVIHGGPVLVNLFGESSRAAGAIGTLWWVAAFLPLVLTQAVKGEGSMGPFPVSRPKGVLVLGIALLVAAVAHIFSTSWAHVVSFEMWHPSALFLGLAAAWPRLVPSKAREIWTVRLSLGAATLALVLAGTASPGQSIFLGPVETTPFRAIAVLATFALGDAAWQTRRPRVLYAALATGLLAYLGGTPAEIDASFFVPSTGTKVVLSLVALVFTLVRVDHPVAALAGLAASWVLLSHAQGPYVASHDRGPLFASFAALHQLVLAHRHRSASWLKLRTLLAWATLLLGLGAVRSGVSLVDLYVLGLVGGAYFAWIRGFGRGYQWPATLVLVVLVVDRFVRNAPSDRTSIGIFALSGGVLLLGAGLGFSVMRQRLAGSAEPPQVVQT